MVADYSIVCQAEECDAGGAYEDEYGRIRYLALTVIVFWAIGVPVGYVLCFKSNFCVRGEFAKHQLSKLTTFGHISGHHWTTTHPRTIKIGRDCQ